MIIGDQVWAVNSKYPRFRRDINFILEISFQHETLSSPWPVTSSNVRQFEDDTGHTLSLHPILLHYVLNVIVRQYTGIVASVEQALFWN